MANTDKFTALDALYTAHEQMLNAPTKESFQKTGAAAIIALLLCDESQRDCETFLTCAYVLSDAFLRFYRLGAGGNDPMPCDLGDKTPFPVTAEYVYKMIITAKNRCQTDKEKSAFLPEILALEKEYKQTTAFQKWWKKFSSTPPQTPQ